MSLDLDTSGWPSSERVVLPSRAFLTSWKEQTLPARRAALADSVDYARSLADGPTSGERDLAVLAVVSDAMQALEDLAYLVTSWDEPFKGLANYVRATVYSDRTPTNFWQGARKRDDEYLDVMAGFSSRDQETGAAINMLSVFGGSAALTRDVLAALEEARHATRRRLRIVLPALADAWQQFAGYFYAYKHGGLVVNRADVHWHDASDPNNASESTRRPQPSLAAWFRAGKAEEGHGEFGLSTEQIIREVDGPGRIAIDLVEAFVTSRAASLDAVNFDDDGAILSLNPMQLPWTVWLKEAELPPATWRLIGRGPRITWTSEASRN